MRTVSEASRRIAREHPLRVRAVGWIGSRLLVARSNWDILEVRDLEGRLVMRHEVALRGEYLLHPNVSFAGGRFLVVETGGGVVAIGCRVWSFEEGRWCALVEGYGDDVTLVGVDAARARVALSDGRGVDVVEIGTQRVDCRLALSSPRSVAFHPDEAETTVAGGGAHMLGSAQGAGVIALLERGRVCRSIETSPTDWSGGASVAWLDRDRIAALTFEGRAVILDRTLRPLRELGALGKRESDVAVADGRWVTVPGARETWIFDAADERPVRTVVGFAFVDAGAQRIVVAGEEAVRFDPL